MTPTTAQRDDSAALYSAHDSIESRLRTLVAQKLKVQPDSITGDAHFSELPEDSLAVLETLFEIESAFDISLPEDVQERLVDFRGLLALVEEKIRTKATPTYLW